MRAARLCQLQETFQREWMRDFPNGPYSVLGIVDDVIKKLETNGDAGISDVISDVHERLVDTNDKIIALQEQLHREIVVKQFLIRVLEILDSSIDFSAQLMTICSQIFILTNWKSSPTLAGFVDKASTPKCSYSESLKLNSTFGDKRLADRSNTLPRLCYSSSNSRLTKKENDKKHDDNLAAGSEYDEMFKRKKNPQKPNDGDSGNHVLGAKDNFLAVKSKHIASSVISSHPQDIITKSPNLTRNFQLLKLTEGFDLVLGDSSVGDDKKGQHLQPGGRDDKVPEKSTQRIEITRKVGESSQIPPLSQNNENVTTIQIRKSEVRNYREGEGLKGYDHESEVTPTKQTFPQESDTLVRGPASENVGSVREGSPQNVNNFEQRIGHSQSFQNSLRKFSTKSPAVPPPVAKKPARAGSSNKLPTGESPNNNGSICLETETTVIVDSTTDVGSVVVNTSQSLREFNCTTSTVVLSRSKSVEGIRSEDRSILPGKNELEGIISTTDLQVPEEGIQVETCDQQTLLQPGGSSEKDCAGFETGVSRDVRDNDLNEVLLQSGRALETSEITSQTEIVTEMSFYRLRKNSGNSSHRNSVENLVEGVGYNLINIQSLRLDDVPKSSKSDSPPEIPCRMPIHSQTETDFISSRTEGIVDCHIFVSSASKETEDIVFDCETDLPHGVKDVPHTWRNASQSEKPGIVDHSSETKKRLSSTSSYENWTINRAITTSNADCFSISDDDELDDIPASPVAEVPASPITASPSIEREVVSIGSKDSGLCEDISSSEVSHSNSDIVSIRGREQGATPQLEHDAPDADEHTLRDLVYLETHLTNEVPYVRSPEVGQRRRQREEDITETLSVDRLSVDTLSVPSDGDEEAGHGMDSSCEETDSARDGMLKMRRLLVKGVLDSEKSYLGILSLLIDYKRSLEASSISSQPVISRDDIQTIFSNIETVNDIHMEFVHLLEAKVVNWTHEEKVGEIFKIMISKMINFGNYLNNYQQAVSTIHKCCQESDQFDLLAKQITVNSTVKEVTSLEDALFKPVQRVQRNTLVLHDLIKYTPEDHSDYHALQKALKLSQQIIENFATLIPKNVNTQENRRLVKSSFLVEDVGGVRKLRFIFLFSDVLVCTKREIRRNNKVTFDIKWFAPLTQSSIDTRFSYSDEGKTSTKDDISEVKTKLKGLKRELKAEIRKSDDKDRHRTLVSLTGVGTRNVDKLRKKINQTEAQLILASPKLPFKVLIEGGRSYTLLMSTDYEREEWKETMATLFRKFSRSDQSATTMSSIYIQELINSVKETPQVNKIGNVLLKKDEDVLTGILNVTIHKVNGVSEICNTYCNLEMDSFGHFFFKARTTICERTQDPTWNEDFDLELEGSETLRILCFKKEPGGQGDTLLGRGALELSQQWLKGSFQEKTLSMNEISLVISMRHIPASKTMQRTPSRTSSAVFGVSISSCAKREGKTVPMIVTACVQEVEKRGLDEVGIYRVSGVSSDLQHIKRLIDKNFRSVVILQDADIHSVTGILKLYLRELPEPLFTEANYHNFVDTLKLCDDEAKTQCMLALLHALPDTNYYTIVYLLEHLIKVAKQVGVNKMSIQNLSTIFGPTLLAPATKQTSSNPLEMMCKGAEEVMHQSTIVNFLLGLAVCGRSLRRSAQ